MIFVDTTFWVGDADANDDFHSSAHSGVEAIRKGATPMAFTSDFVIDEVVTILGGRKGFGAQNAVKVSGEKYPCITKSFCCLHRRALAKGKP